LPQGFYTLIGFVIECKASICEIGNQLDYRMFKRLVDNSIQHPRGEWQS